MFGGPLDKAVSQDPMNGLPRVGRNRMIPVTGLHAIPPSKSRSRERRQNLEESQLERSLSQSKQSGHVTHPEIARVRVLLLTSAVKAREIYRRANSVREPPPAFLVEAFHSAQNELTKSSMSGVFHKSFNSTGNSNIPPILRKDELVTASKAHLSILSAASDTIRSRISHFNSTTVPNLHRSLASIEDLLENSLTPRVRFAADSAGELSQSLTTTSTLAVKQLNDSVEAAARRRRRGIFGGGRLVRRAGYTFLEGIVVGSLWGVWGVVSVCRLIRGILRLIVMILRWLLWL